MGINFSFSWWGCLEIDGNEEGRKEKEGERRGRGKGRESGGLRERKREEGRDGGNGTGRSSRRKIRVLISLRDGVRLASCYARKNRFLPLTLVLSEHIRVKLRAS